MRYLIFVFFGFFVLSCGQQEQQHPQPQGFSTKLASVAEVSQEYWQYKNNHPTRLVTLQKAHKIYNTGEVCDQFLKCVDLCFKIFLLDVEQQECKRLPFYLVNNFDSVYQAFKSKQLVQIQSIDFSHLKIFITFSQQASWNLFGDLGFSLAQNILKWLAYDSSKARVLADEDLDHSLLEILLSEMGAIPIESLGEAMENKRTFQEIAILRQNNFALSWVHGFFKKQCSTKTSQDECVLEQYCEIYPNLHQDTAIEINEFNPLKTILKNKQQSGEASLTLAAACFG